MSTTELEQTGSPEVEAVFRWRFEELVRAGYEPGCALIVASHVDVDLHDATRLLARGCPHETVMRIIL